MEKMLLIVNPISGGKDKKKVIRAIENGLDKNRFQWDITLSVPDPRKQQADRQPEKRLF